MHEKECDQDYCLPCYQLCSQPWLQEQIDATPETCSCEERQVYRELLIAGHYVHSGTHTQLTSEEVGNLPDGITRFNTHWMCYRQYGIEWVDEPHHFTPEAETMFEKLQTSPPLPNFIQITNARDQGCYCELHEQGYTGLVSCLVCNTSLCNSDGELPPNMSGFFTGTRTDVLGRSMNGHFCKECFCREEPPKFTMDIRFNKYHPTFGWVSASVSIEFLCKD